jgi:hypothetical protein
MNGVMELPVPTRVLFYIIEKGARSKEDVIRGIGEGEGDVSEALKKLVEMNVLEMKGNVYVAKDRAKGLSTKLLKLYEKVNEDEMAETINRKITDLRMLHYQYK